MDLFGIGPLEIIVVLVISILVLGPEGMVKTGKRLGKLLRSVVTSEGWQRFQDYLHEIRTLPHTLMREAHFEELDDLNNDFSSRKEKPPPETPPSNLGPSAWRGHSIFPPSASKDEENSSSP
jgi:Sec-independent protein translocase protein TatA